MLRLSMLLIRDLDKNGHFLLNTQVQQWKHLLMDASSLTPAKILLNMTNPYILPKISVLTKQTNS